MKRCTTCGIEKPTTTEYFHWRKDTGNFRANCKECYYATRKVWAKENKDKVNEYYKQKRKANPEYYNAISKKYRDRNPEKRRIACIKWQKENPEQHRAIQKKARDKNRRTTKGNLNHRIGVAVQRALKGNKTGRKWEDLLGYTVDKLKKHLEGLFTEGMTWEQLLEGKIHIDHIIPISVFNFTKPCHTDFKRCWALKNLQPLWAKDNQSKYAKLEKHFQPTLF